MRLPPDGSEPMPGGSVEGWSEGQSRPTHESDPQTPPGSLKRRDPPRASDSGRAMCVMRFPKRVPGVRCTARRRRSLLPCKAWAVPGWAVCRMHGAGGGRPIIHGRRSKVPSRLWTAYRRHLASIAFALERIGHRPSEEDLRLLSSIFGESAQCSATSRRTGQRCRRRTPIASSVCYYHGSGGGRPRADGLSKLERVLGLAQSMEFRLARRTGERVQRMLRGKEVSPSATESEEETVRLLRTCASFNQRNEQI